jgi:DNA-binding PadR family transcriptional regulator
VLLRTQVTASFALTMTIVPHSISVTDILMKPLTPAVFHILLALSNGERHGYAIMREVAADTGNSFTMGPGTLYGTLVRMLDAGLVEECGERRDPEMNEERRRYYRLTSKGRRAAVDEAKRLNALVRSARAKSLLGRLKA